MPAIYQNMTKQPDQGLKQILDSREDLCMKGLTIASGQGVLVEGQVLAIITATGKGVKFAGSGSPNTDGSQIAKAILMEGCDATSQDCFVKVAISGRFLKDQLTTYDSKAQTDLGAREVTEFNLVIVP